MLTRCKKRHYRHKFKGKHGTETNWFLPRDATQSAIMLLPQ